MRPNAIRISLALAAAIALPSLVAAQMPSLQELQVADIETMKGKFIGLAQEFTEAQYDWRPMDGVRSVREVLSLMITECNMTPSNWGVAPPAGAGTNFREEMQRTQALSRAQIITDLGSSFDHLIASVRGMTGAQLMAQSNYFGRQMPAQGNAMTATADMHEHLGQLIAYARMNHVVPPWSR